MAEEIITSTGEGEGNKNPIDPRLKELLTDKTKLSEEVVAKDNTIKQRDDKIAELERENAFNSGFADMLSTHSAAKDHKDEIKTKVLSGYTVEDATLAVLGKAGKLGNTAQQTFTTVAGGSAVNNVQNGQKEIKDMTQAERRDELSKILTIA